MWPDKFHRYIVYYHCPVLLSGGFDSLIIEKKSLREPTDRKTIDCQYHLMNEVYSHWSEFHFNGLFGFGISTNPACRSPLSSELTPINHCSKNCFQCLLSFLHTMPIKAAACRGSIEGIVKSFEWILKHIFFFFPISVRSRKCWFLSSAARLWGTHGWCDFLKSVAEGAISNKSKWDLKL